MQRIEVAERNDWRSTAHSMGFHFHTINGEPYWQESAYYALTLKQIEEGIEEPTNELHEMALSLVDDIVRDESLLSCLDIPVGYWDWIAASWKRRDPHLYGRMDFSYDGRSPAKLLELNYDTPTSLYETGAFQWVWLEQAVTEGLIPRDFDQFNSVHDQLIAALCELRRSFPATLHVSSVAASIEDRGTVKYLADCARQAGFDTKFVAVEDIGIDMRGRYTDLNEHVIEALFKLYPWEFMLREEFGAHLPRSATRFLEPPWKSILSNKGILPLLWAKYPNHPNLLESHFTDATLPPRSQGWVVKPLYSREGANVAMITDSAETIATSGPYASNRGIAQRFHSLPRFGGAYALVGSWVIGDVAAGIGMREDDSLITRDTSCFVPHVITQ